MIGALKAVLAKAAQARQSGEAKEAERLYKEAAAQAEADDAVERAEALTGVAQARRDASDRTGAAIYYAEAITLFRTAGATLQLAHALRHAADVRSQIKEYGVAGTQIEEAIRLYRALGYAQDEQAEPLDLANALRVSALNDERRALAAWTEAAKLYREHATYIGVDPAGDQGVLQSEDRVRRLRAAMAEGEERP